jgi:hypothetical protein
MPKCTLLAPGAGSEPDSRATHKVELKLELLYQNISDHECSPRITTC